MPVWLGIIVLVAAIALAMIGAAWPGPNDPPHTNPRGRREALAIMLIIVLLILIVSCVVAVADAAGGDATAPPPAIPHSRTAFPA